MSVAEKGAVLIEGAAARILPMSEEWLSGSDGATFEDLNPTTMRVMQRAPNGTAADVDRAIAAAWKAQLAGAQMLPADSLVHDELRCPIYSMKASGSVGRWSGVGAIEALADQRWISAQVAAGQYPF